MQNQCDVTLIFESRVPRVAVDMHNELLFMQFIANSFVFVSMSEYWPLSVVMAEKFEQLRDWAADRTVAAD
jgi:hypothetical protein